MTKRDLTKALHVSAGKSWSPEIYDRKQGDNEAFSQLLATEGIHVLDTIEDQLAELITLRRPGHQWTESEKHVAVRSRLGEHPDRYGVWVYYPWRHALVHLLPEEEFREVRTNRNMHKITAEEQGLLAKKRIAIAGLSVGSGIAMALAMERIGGELRLADFDDLELSNLNRIRSSVLNLKIPKAVVVAREIAELDPFIKVVLFEDGVTPENIEEFLGGEQPVDLLLEECDSFLMKLSLRWEARERKIPVVMDTSDRGLIDVERFDLNPNAGLLHGRFSDEEVRSAIDANEWNPEWLFRMVRQDELSERMLLSMKEMNKTVSRWPQVASEVVMGAGVAAQICRMILLGDGQITGRKFIDINEFYLDK